MKNKYCHYSHLTEHKFRQLLECFSDDLSTIITSKITGVPRQTVTQYFNWFRERIYQLVVNNISMFESEVEIDKSYFGVSLKEELENKTESEKKFFCFTLKSLSIAGIIEMIVCTKCY